jgi:hypothetical protein
MLLQQESALEVCQRAENMLREVQGGELVPGNDMLAQWETELGKVAALLEAAHDSMTEEFRPRNNPAVGQALMRIRHQAGMLKIQFEHGSNYCMGLLQARLGTGYSEHGLPVLMPTKSRGAFEG